MQSSVLIDKIEEVWIIRLNLPQSMNSLEKDLRDNLKSSLIEFSRNEGSRVAILTGSGRAFSAGGSLKELAEGMNAIQCSDYMKDVNDLILLITGIEKPIIACVNGAAVGAGFNIALACDMIIASTNAMFSQAFAKVGLVPDMGGLYFLPKVVGMHKAKELIYTATVLNVEDAQKIGIVNKVIPHDKLESYTIEFAKDIAKGPAKAFGFAKMIMSRSWELSLSNVLQYEAFAQSVCMQSNDHKEGVRAFYDKRKPVFQGK